jgi:hypothetical protein
MAGDWIKMRGSLLASPKVIAIARMLHEGRDFREWLTPGGGGPTNGRLISDEALRCVTVALLMRVWSVAREHGHYVGEDLFFPCIGVDDLDQIANASGMGTAMEAVGWAVPSDDGRGVTLPNFKDSNVPLTAAEKQKGYRDRARSVTEPLPRPGNAALPPCRGNVTPREEKSREEIEKTPLTPQGGDGPSPRPKRKPTPEDPEGFAAFWEAYPRHEARQDAARAFAKLSPGKALLDLILAAIERQRKCGCLESRVAADGRSVIPYPATWLNKRRWEDAPPPEPANGQADRMAYIDSLLGDLT